MKDKIKDNVFYLNIQRQWKKSDGSFRYSDSDFIFFDNGFNYYKYIDYDGYITYIKVKSNK